MKTPSPAFREFCKANVPRLAEEFRDEAIKAGLSFDKARKIREETSGADIFFPDVCDQPDGNPNMELVTEWAVAFHEALTEDWRRTYAGMKETIANAINDCDLPEDDRDYLRRMVICDDAKETFRFNGDSERAKEILARCQ